MALLKNVTLPNGLAVPAAYIRIDSISGFKSQITVSVNYYVSEQSYRDGSSYLHQEFYSFVPNLEDGAVNFFKQGYEYLKTLPEFEGAIDIED